MIRSDSRGLTLTFQLVCTLVATVPSEWHSWSGASKITGNFSAHVRNSTTRLYDELDNPEDTAFDLYNSDYGLLRRSDPYAVLSHGVSGSWKNNKGCAYFFKLTFTDSQREREIHTRARSHMPSSSVCFCSQATIFTVSSCGDTLFLMCAHHAGTGTVEYNSRTKRFSYRVRLSRILESLNRLPFL